MPVLYLGGQAQQPLLTVGLKESTKHSRILVDCLALF